MVEDNITTAIKGFTDADPVLGGVIILLLGALIWQNRFFLGIINELKADLVSERADHQKTRLSQVDDLRNHARLAESVDALRDTLVRKA